MKGLPARTGLDWLRQGLAIFRQQPGVLMMIIFTNMMVTMLVSTLPLLGTVVALLAIPSFTIAIQQACRMIDEGQRVHPRVLLTGFRKEAIRPLFKLGTVYLAIVILCVLVMFSMLDMAALEAMRKTMQAKQTPVLDQRTQMVFNGCMLLMGVLMMALSFAPALTHWKRMPTFKAMFYSVFAMLGSKAALAVMILGWMGCYTLATVILSALLGKTAIGNMVVIWMTFVAVLIFHCAIYAAYKQLLGVSEDDAAPAK